MTRPLAENSATSPTATAFGTPAAAKVVAELVAADEPAVICAHRENLPALFAAACAELGAPDQADGLKPLRKGEFLVLHRAARTMASAERYHPDGRC